MGKLCLEGTPLLSGVSLKIHMMHSVLEECIISGRNFADIFICSILSVKCKYKHHKPYKFQIKKHREAFYLLRVLDFFVLVFRFFVCLFVFVSGRANKVQELKITFS